MKTRAGLRLIDLGELPYDPRSGVSLPITFWATHQSFVSITGSRFMPTRMDRRVFVRNAGAAIVGGGAAALGRPVVSLADGAAQPRFRFAQINDTHVQGPLEKNDGIRTYAKANEKLQACVDVLNDVVRPDIVLGLGDLIHGERLDRLAVDMEAAKALLKPLRPAFYPTIGNHEIVQREGAPEYERAYRDVFGDDRVNYTFEHGGLRFILFNNGGATVVADAVIRARNAWLRETLARHRGQPTIIGCHIPLVSVRDEPVLARSFGFSSYRAHDPELLGLIDEHADSVVAVLSGHLHLTGCVEREGVWHVSICGTASYPSDFASFDVFDDRIEMTVHALPADLANAAPTIHGRPRHPQDFTDAFHATAQTYQAGRHDERRLTIPLTG
jgi:predicted MPP superfamily phosphohydrolase